MERIVNLEISLLIWVICLRFMERGIGVVSETRALNFNEYLDLLVCQIFMTGLVGFRKDQYRINHA